MRRASATPWRRPNVRQRHSQRRWADPCRMGRRRCASHGSSPTWPPSCATRCAPRVPGSARQHLRSQPVQIPSSNTPSTCLPPSPCSQESSRRFNRNGLKQNQNPVQLPRNFGLRRAKTGRIVAGLAGGRPRVGGSRGCLRGFAADQVNDAREIRATLAPGIVQAKELGSGGSERRGSAGGGGRFLRQLEILQHERRGKACLVGIVGGCVRYRAWYGAIAGKRPALPRGGGGHVEQRLV